jgi:DNA invertase Pin-like site-specific DNA recombinase
MAAKLLEDFLKRHPKVKKKGKGRYGSRAKPAVPAKVVKRILAMRAGGETLRAIGREVGLSESAVSRICSGSRHGKHGK